MRTLRRIFVNALAVLSLLLCLASIGLWVRSYWRSESLEWLQPANADASSYYLGVEWVRGGVSIQRAILSPDVVRSMRWDGWRWRSHGNPPSGFPRAFNYDSYSEPDGRSARITFPAWFSATVFALLPAVRLALSLRRGGRGRNDHCRNCGYDLRATPERCPECGTMPVR